MSRNYKFHNPEGAYFVSFAVVDWLDVFTRKEYRNILLESLAYCQKEKGMELYAWCIMTNHLHLVFRSVGGLLPQNILGDFKRFTSKKLVKAILENSKESRKTQFINAFRSAALKSSNVRDFQFWQHDNHPIEVWSLWVTRQKINYVHNNPVKQGIVSKPEDYLYSSARDYSGQKGLLSGVVVLEAIK